MLVYTLFILAVAGLLYVDYATNLKVIYKTQKFNINNLAIFLALGIIVIFAGFRYEIGYDYPKYLAGFLFDSELEKWEPFFNATVYFLREVNFGLDSQMLFLFYSVVSISVLYVAVHRLTPHYRVAILIYLMVPAFYLNSFSVIRQGLAMVILLYGLPYLTKEYKLKKYLLVAFVAYMFHSISIVVAIAYVLFERFFKQTYSWITYVTMLIGSLAMQVVGVATLILTYAPGHYHMYIYHYAAVNPLKLLIVNGLFLFLMFQKRQFITTRLDNYLLNSMLVGTIIFNIFASYADVTRLAQYFLMTEIILVARYIYSFHSQLKRMVVLGLFLLYYLFNFEYALYRDIHTEGSRPHFLVPYENYLLVKSKSDKEKYQQKWIEFYQRIGVLK